MKICLLRLIGKYCITIKDGQTVYDTVHPLLSNTCRKVELDFTDVMIVAPPFINYAIGRLYKDISSADVKSQLSFSNLSSLNSKVLALCLENAERYWTDSNYKDAVDQVMKEQSVE